ncbi:MAG: Asp-tRNA(Asn)/Glu-tRNA(Gln) amidotransferase subunit GatB [Candidatus Aenigmarchaeota archaeon]|nr:Asp-tRNA(Asn)/Glu-tRNA(Gln) amidotransferase subunit GatB [Candidatus Aenigmarchaeota archaeon]
MIRIGVEVHVQLTTNTKLFCGCPNRFTQEPNILVCETCLGFPGSKPVVNAKAIEYGTRVGLALGCKFPAETFFSRKSYFYPDMSKNFQISQYEIPLCKSGELKTGNKKIHITRINLEEDPARITHIGTITQAKYILVDYNRSGTPLCEIVTEPDFESPAEVRQFLQELSSMLDYLGVYDSSVEGSLRVDANISVTDDDQSTGRLQRHSASSSSGLGGNRVEVKNISGFRDVEKALNYEIIRQRNQLRRGERVVRETRAWDAAAGVTRSLRKKEEEEDYGYIFDTDLPLITLSSEKIDEIKKKLPEFAAQKVERYVKLGIQRDLAVSITSEPEIAVMFEEVVKKVSPRLAASFFAGELKKSLNFRNLRLRDTKLEPSHMVALMGMIEDAAITERAAELMLRDMIIHPHDPTQLMMAKEMGRIDDEAQLEKFVADAMSENYKAVLDYRAGRAEAFDFLVGQVMRKTRGRGDPVVIRKILQKKLPRD